MAWNYYAQTNLRRMGVSEHTPDLGELIVYGILEHTAYCKSSLCSPGYRSRGTPKRVKRQEERCPDCGYFLFWKTRVAHRQEQAGGTDEGAN